MAIALSAATSCDHPMEVKWYRAGLTPGSEPKRNSRLHVPARVTSKHPVFTSISRLALLCLCYLFTTRRFLRHDIHTAGSQLLATMSFDTGACIPRDDTRQDRIIGALPLKDSRKRTRDDEDEPRDFDRRPLAVLVSLFMVSSLNTY